MSSLKKESLKSKISKTAIGTITKLSPLLSSKLIYRIHLHKKLNLKNPKTFNEKLMYLKLNDYYNNELVTKCSDKIKVGEFLKEKGLNITNEIIGIYDKAEEISFDELPKKFALKCNHGCGYNIICTDKENLDIESAKKQLNYWVKHKFGYVTCEPHYFKINPKIYVEKYIETKDGILPNDYKIYCFNGKAKVILVCSEREKKLKLKIYDLNWKELDYITDEFKTKKEFEKPKHLKEMIKAAEILSKQFPFVRVDFYDLEDKILLGELTYTPARCSAEYYNEKGEIELGNMLDINIKKKQKKVMFISSVGGHLTQLLELKNIFNDYNYVLVTEKTSVTKPMKEKYKMSFFPYGSRNQKLTYPFILIANCFLSLFYFIKYNPNVIITTGANTCAAMCCLGKIFGKKVIYIESFAKRTSPTVTGKMIYKLHAYTTFVVQWEEMLKVYPKAEYWGGIY